MSYWNGNYDTWNRPMSNIQYATSLEEALSRCNIRNLENVFFHQDLPIFWRIKVESDGRKYWQEFHYDAPKQVDNTPVVKQDLMAFEDRLKIIENLLFNKGVTYEQSDGQISVSTELANSPASSGISTT